MWGSQGWSQWALQPAMFNDVPHEQIDWAELAKQWIQMQQTPPSDGAPPPLPPQIHPPLSLSHPPGHPHIPDEISERSINPPLLKNLVPPGHVPELFHTDRPFDPEAGGNFMPKSGESNFWSKPQWSGSNNVDERLWNAPVEPVAPPILGGKETFDYGHVHDNPPLAMQTIDYNHMSDYPYNQVYTPPVPPPMPVPESQYDQYWSQVNAAPTIAPIFLKKERNITSNVPPEEETTQIDAAKRKQLPAWIRDGLEKMEQERLKRLEKERNAKERDDKLSKAKSEINSRSTSFVPKSKFESDSEEEQVEEAPVKRDSPIMKRLPSPIEDMRSEEEKKQDLMLKVRRTLTEVLLSVTNTEMMAIAQEVFKKAKAKAPARQLASTTSLTTVASGLRGLASYDSGTDASEAEDRSETSDSEEELYRKIKEKKRLFAVKEKKIIADLDRKELEDKTDREKMNNGNMTVDKNVKENIKVEIEEEAHEELNSENNKLSPMMPFQRSVSSNDIPFISEKSENESAEDSKQTSETSAKPEQKDGDMNSSEYSSSSSGSESNSSEMNRKKSLGRKEKSSKNEKRDRSISKRDRHHKRKSRDSDSSGRHKRSRTPERKSSNKKRKKSKRSDSSSSSSSVLRRKKSSRKHESNHGRSRRSHSREDRRHRRSVSHSKSHHRSDSHSHKSSRSHRHHDEKHDKRSRDEKKYRDSHRSPSPFSRSSKIPKKYRASRSLSSESEIYGKKSKKSRNH